MASHSPSAYSQSLQKSCSTRRLKAVDSEASDEEVEEQFTMQLEQLILQCDDELSLIPKMAEWKPWDVPAGHKVPPCSALQLLSPSCIPAKPCNLHITNLGRHDFAEAIFSMACLPSG